MIPSTTNRLLVTEDWKKIYQSFRNAEFKSYDFETLRRSMIAYLRENYPEEFNDYIDSSEYVALIDLIAFLGQNLSFRIDLNARENFLETAERRESVLRLAQLISYNPRRNTAANGLLKVQSIMTTDAVFDATGVNLARSAITWNDSANLNWYQQFIAIINSAFNSNNGFGNPIAKSTISGIPTEQYQINSSNREVPVYSFSKSISGTQMNFEIVSSGFAGKNFIYEQPPQPGSKFNLLFRNDNQGSGSSNTGFFVHFRQGTLGSTKFTISNPVPNEIAGINIPNINDTDVWLWSRNADGTKLETLWTKVSSTTGNNVIYNDVASDVRNFYSVISRANDAIDLSFSDGNFGNLPLGSFDLYYRQSNGLSYSIKPEQMNNISVQIPYINSIGQNHTLTLILSLRYTVSNSAPAQTNSEIKQKAPQTYYTQNRMVTGEDYNIAPLNVATDIIKVKSVNRTSSGVSKFFELSDVSGAYGYTDIFASDGALYKLNSESSFEFSFRDRNDLFAKLQQQVEPLLNTPELKSFYLDRENYPRPDLAAFNLVWQQTNVGVNQSRGFFKNFIGPARIGLAAENPVSLLKEGTLVKFIAPNINGVQQYFLPNGKYTARQDLTTSNYIWVQVVKVIGDGSNSGEGALPDGTGPVVLSQVVPSEARISEIIPPYETRLSFNVSTDLFNIALNKRSIGLSFDSTTRTWFLIADTNLSLVDPFSLQDQGDSTNTNIDSSWLVSLQWTGRNYLVRYRRQQYFFESQRQTAFYVDEKKKNFDFVFGKTVKDYIDVLSINTKPTQASELGKDLRWQINSAVVEPDGYVEPKRVVVDFFDFDDNGKIDDPDIFEIIVDPNSNNTQTNFKDKFVYFVTDGVKDTIVDQPIFAYPNQINVPLASLVDGQLYYFYTPNVVKRWDEAQNEFVLEPNYSARIGRKGLKFHYVHNSGSSRRLDPSKSNIIDVYVLSAEYDREFRGWLNGTLPQPPLLPTTQSIEESYKDELDPIKCISDELIFQPAKYKILFGTAAPIELQATFKAVKSTNSVASDTDIQNKIFTAINEFFAIENWDFGQTFNFSELNTFVMNSVAPDVTNFVIVPKLRNSSFGSLFQIQCQSNEIFISGTKIQDIQIISGLTATELNSQNIIV